MTSDKFNRAGPIDTFVSATALMMISTLLSETAQCPKRELRGPLGVRRKRNLFQTHR